ncbi:MAG: hypothetical protein COB67_00095 [SAR324 cluster bacterium]|uniref:Uncharacterized protein n=1 Tax=SAR324 cluster bacterium TaxID=2024889 RepID=A0A2A4TC37_9DELT|nr:MAG: hypothetical protein COB67_00095 [SAR324 cluster bacterium]
MQYLYLSIKLFIIMTIFNTTLTADNNVLPSGWTSYIKGIKVTEKNLGSYQGIYQIEERDFYLFDKSFTFNNEEQLCTYPVLKDEPHYIGMIFCNNKK